MNRPSTKLRLHGLIGLAVIAAGVMIPIGVYNQAFSSPVTVTYVAPNAGLLLVPGAEVRLRGVHVGRVDSVRSTGAGARLALALDKEQTRLIPADVTARITPSTVAGAPHVELIASEQPASAGATIQAGASIPSAPGVPSVNDIFQETVSLLQAIPVQEMNTTLSALAAALDGRGERLGATLSTLSRYVRTINGQSKTLSRDITLSAAVASQYAEIAQPLLDVMRHSTVTADTLVVRSSDLDELLDAGNRLSAAGQPLIDNLQKPLTAALRLLDPVTGLLAEYSPEFPCVLKALEHQALKNNLSLGVKYPGAQAIMTILPGQRGYRYPDDLPKFVDDRGPTCYSLPALEGANYPLPYRRYNDNSNANEDGTTKLVLPPISFFGPPKPVDDSGGSSP